jgi:hypothetical protein
MTAEEIPPLPPEESVEQPQVVDEQGNRPDAQVVPTKLNSLEQLKEISEPLYRAIMEGIFTMFSGFQNRSNERIKKALREGSRQR